MSLNNIINNETYFQSYISNLNPIDITSVGALTIIDNTQSNKSDMVQNSYNLFVDNTFISGGYGFSSYAEYTNGSYLVSSYNTIIQSLDNNINEVYNHIPSISVNNDIIINKKHNSYGFVISYDKLSYVFNEENKLYNIKTVKYTENIPYITNIDISKDDEEISFTKCQINISYTINLVDYNINDLPLSLIVTDSLNTQTTTIDENNKTLIFNANEDNNIIFKDDLIIKLISDNGEVYYNNILKDYIEYKDSVIVCTKFVGDSNENYNFRNSNFSGDIKTGFINSFMSNNSQKEETSIIIDNNEFEFTLYSDNSEGHYDYFIVNHNKYYGKIKFYYNGIQINNWKLQEFDDLYIYQSPQKYIGSRTWTVKIS